MNQPITLVSNGNIFGHKLLFRYSVLEDLRSNDRKLHLNRPNTNFTKSGFSYRGAVSWDSLPAEIADVYDQLSLYSFKTLINHHYKDLEGSTSTIQMTNFSFLKIVVIHNSNSNSLLELSCSYRRN